MSFYIKLSTLEYPRHQGDIRLEHPEIGNDFVCPETYAIVENGTIPTYDPSTQQLKENAPFLNDGVWYKNWYVYNYTDDELNMFNQFRNS